MVIDPTGVMLMVTSLLDEMDIRYVIGGSYASSLHGFSRSTGDIDMLAAIKPEQAAAFAAQLQSDFYADEQAIERAVRAKRHFNVIHLDSAFKVDIFVAKPSEFDSAQLERRQESIIETDLPQKVYVATAEDTILAKLDWYRRGNEVSDRQWKDISGVIRVQGDRLDLEYLRHWAQELGVLDLLERALAESENR